MFTCGMRARLTFPKTTGYKSVGALVVILDTTCAHLSFQANLHVVSSLTLPLPFFPRFDVALNLSQPQRIFAVP